MQRVSILVFAVLVTVAAGCSSGDELATDQSSTTSTSSTRLAPSTTALTGMRSGEPEPAAPVAAGSATTVVQPEPEVSTT
ncbi:MAG: hypothetical protein EX269_16495, partial [Acidimicrobiales bacterium]